MYERAASQGTAFKTRDEAVARYRADNASKYKTDFATEPATRPSYVPTTTTVNGSNYNVEYNRDRGGYGYNGPSGWSSYNPLMDVLILSALMDNDNYVVVPPTPAAPAPAAAPVAPVAQSQTPTQVAQSSEEDGGWGVIGFVFIAIVCIGGVVLAAKAMSK